MAGGLNDTSRDDAGRFRPGAPSPNPRGRPKKANNVDAALIGALSEKITVTEQGKRRRKSKLAIAATQIVNKAAGGDLPAAKVVLTEVRKAEERAEKSAIRAPAMTKNDREIAAQVIARIAAALEQGGADGPVD